MKAMKNMKMMGGMSGMKDTGWGPTTQKFGGFYEKGMMPSTAWSQFAESNSNMMNGMSKDSMMKGSMMGKKKWTATCKGCGGKL